MIWVYFRGKEAIIQTNLLYTTILAIRESSIY